jgi:cell division protein FtsI (penicillin-binding protein 3)
MSVGYELKLTPLQILRFYNAIANDGVMMKPFLVDAILDGTEIVETFSPVVQDKSIARPETIIAIRRMMEKVVEEGTAKRIKSQHYKFAGKTGTARTDYYKDEKRRQYNASFAGFFPSEDPAYSCIVVVYHPQVGGIYGGDVAGPVFRSIADKCMALYGKDDDAINELPKPIMASYQLPRYDVGLRSEISSLCKMIGLDYDMRSNDEFAITIPDEHQVRIETRKVDVDKVPNLMGMGLRDAVYAIERTGARPRIYGVGKVSKQEPKAGEEIRDGQIIDIKLD